MTPTKWLIWVFLPLWLIAADETLIENEKANATTQNDAAEDRAAAEETGAKDQPRDPISELNRRLDDRSLKGLNTPFNQAKFLPNISLIIDGGYADLDEENGVGHLPGFGHGHDHEHGGTFGEDGFNLNYGELAMSASIDPYLDLFATFHLSESSFEIEEAYATTRSLPRGFQIKFGKFLSGFGRQNGQHQHYWDFADAALVVEAMLGEHGLLEKGIQVNYLAPTSHFLRFGLELLQGENHASFGLDGFEVEGEHVDDADAASLVTGFAKWSTDLGAWTILAGASVASGDSRQAPETEEHDDHDHATWLHKLPMAGLRDDDHDDDHHENGIPGGVSGETELVGIEFTLKRPLDSFTYVAFQAEYLRRQTDGEFFMAHGDEHGEDGEHDEGEDEPHHGFGERDQAGLYAQVTWRFDRRWRVGARYDVIDRNNWTLAGEALEVPDDATRQSLMLEVNPSEFSRIRFQWNRDESTYLDADQLSFDEWFVQFNLSIGAHGAHPF